MHTDSHNRSAPIADLLDRWTRGTNRFDTPITGLSLHRWEHTTEPTSYMLAPSLCLIGQGRKRLVLGDEAYDYDPATALVTSLDLPVVSNITEATKDKPYLGLTMELDLRMIARLILEHGTEPEKNSTSGKNATAKRSVAVTPFADNLMNAFSRLLSLLDHPADIPVLAPLIQQEICYRLLKSEHGSRLQQMVSVGNHGYQIARTIEWMKSNYRESIRMEDLARKAGLSVSAFHSHFRSMTAMSPLQFQKKMRLNEARRLMLTGHIDASEAAFEVGYESPSQFSREYSRMFGAPPLRDIRNLKESASLITS